MGKCMQETHMMLFELFCNIKFIFFAILILFNILFAKLIKCDKNNAFINNKVFNCLEIALH